MPLFQILIIKLLYFMFGGQNKVILFWDFYNRVTSCTTSFYKLLSFTFRVSTCAQFCHSDKSSSVFDRL
jgi:hypothetical protein